MIDSPSEPEHMIVRGLLAGKNVLVTGAGKNIGRSLALEMARQGANIYFTDIDQRLCFDLTRELEDCGAQCEFHISDIASFRDTERLCHSLQRDQVAIDILVNNVGINSPVTGIAHLNIAEWQNLFMTNLLGPVHLTKRIAEMMISRKTRGSIIFITSIHQFTPFGRPSYSASKAALGMTIKELALELAPHGIRVNGIAPGAVREKEEKQSYSSKHTPLQNRPVDPCYIGRAGVYLASDFFSRFTTGMVLTVDAGLSLRNYIC